MLLAVFLLLLIFQDPEWRGGADRGIQALKNARYDEAVHAFERAVQLNPSEVTSHLYLGTAFMSQYIPGATTFENQEFARKA